MKLFSNIVPTKKLYQVAQTVARLRGGLDEPVQASIVVPVNAQGDLDTVLHLLESLGQYNGPYTIELILVINNYSPEIPPEEIEDYRLAGVRVVAVPNARKPGEVVIVSARALGVNAAQTDITIHFDADCRIPNPTALLNWYIEQLQGPAELAYSHVAFYDLLPRLSVRLKIGIHHIVRMIKRSVLGIPTTRGSNYAIRRGLFLRLFQQRLISVDMQVGPAAKMLGSRIAYSGNKDRYVYTSGRRFKGGWLKLPRYALRRLTYNIHSLKSIKETGAVKKWHGFDRENENRKTLPGIFPGEEANTVSLVGKKDR